MLHDQEDKQQSKRAHLMPIAEDRIGRPKGRNKARGMRGVVSEREIP